MKKTFLILTTVLVINLSYSQKKQLQGTKKESNKISVLNFGSIHLSGSTDAHSAITDVTNPKVKTDLKKVVSNLVKFQPTIICVEIPPESTTFLNETFQKYKTDQSARINYSDEVNAIALEVARLSGTTKMYGIDSQMNFDYPSLITLANRNPTDSLFAQNIMNGYEQLNQQPILKQFEEINTSSYKSKTFDLYNYLATMHTSGNFEGAEIISKFYERNLKMYTNFSDIPLNQEDRVLIIMGATHSAYFDVFISNSSKYLLEDASNYTTYTRNN